MLEYEAALERILGSLPPPRRETLPPDRALGRILAAAVVAPIDLPPFDNSAMDGYAVRAADTQSPNAVLSLHGRVPAGEAATAEVIAGACVRVFTGSRLPAGADAVIMQEDTAPDPGDPRRIRVLEGVKPWENVRFAGEDVKRGAGAAPAGAVVGAGLVHLLGALGVTQIDVTLRPRVGLLATGSELVVAGEPLPPGGIYESNRAGLAALFTGAGADPRVFPLVKDTLADTRAALEAAFAECDLLVTTGGVSVGELDFVKPAFQALGGTMEFWKVAIRPGRPFVFGRWGDKYLFGLPGNPVSAFVTALLLVRPALRRWQGAERVRLPEYGGVLTQPVANPGERRHFVRVRLDDAGGVTPGRVQGSHILSSLAAANGLLDVAPRTTLPAGTAVRVACWE